ncbi:MAG: glycoside hydrolase family 95 protein, partial [Tannerella sp.]|nr:glycoside hydrolase family 95 protein [Tannerella sp.]
MKKTITLFLTLSLAASCTQESRKPGPLSYYFNQPAKIWEETFPLGNGRIGMMPDGGMDRETVVLNEISMWSGSKQDADNPDALKYLPEIRRLLFEGKNAEAQELMYETFVCRGEGSAYATGFDKPYGSYQLFGNLVIDYDYPDTSSCSAYRRELHIDNAVANVQFRKNGVTFVREAFTSLASDLAVIRLTADRDKSLNFTVSMNRDAERE